MEHTMGISQKYVGKGYADRYLTESEVAAITGEFFQTWDLSGKRILVIIPDSTRTMPMPLFFKLIFEALNGKVKTLDYLVALGTHSAMDDAAINRLVGISAEERVGKYGQVKIFNHSWDRPETLVTVGKITKEETAELSSGMLSMELPVRVNKMVLDYDLVLVCGPIFPHEVAGFSGGNKYFFPGVSGPEVINFTHWLGALITNFETIGIKYTPVRAVINKAVSYIPTPRLFLCPVVKSEGINGLFAGDPDVTWSAAADLSSQVHVKYVDRPYRQVLSVMPHLYDDIWTGAKGMYKMEPVIADGGEVIIYAPHITEISYTHGKVLDEIGYHVRDYFVKQWDKYKNYPWGVVAHSTHLRGMGSYENGIEIPRVQVTLATGVSPERCARINLGYRDPATVNPQDWANRENEGILLVPHAGETLYRLKK
jgi:nickel-dependent lactate racemase